MKHYRDLYAWKIGVELLKEVYRITELLPNTEKYGISQQIHKAATSVLANLAEGFSRYTYADKAHKFVISRGECSEVEVFLFMIIDINLSSEEECKKALLLAKQERKILSGLIKATRIRDKKPITDHRFPITV